MKNNHLFLLRNVKRLTYIAAISLLSSCINGYDDDWTYSTSVTGQTLESPKAEDVTFTKNPEGTSVTLEWPVVMGAGGYEVTVYNADDPNNKVIINGPDIIDGCSTSYSIAEDTNYEFAIKTLGNEAADNKEAEQATTISYSTLVPSIATIPSGTDITQYFIDNPIQSQDTEIAYDLESGGQYTMSGVVDFGSQLITFRGNKVHHPKVTFGADAHFETQAGLKIKFIDFDCSAATSSSATFISLNKTPNESIKLASGHYYISDPIAIQSCNITNLYACLFYDNQVRKYCVENFLVKDCVLGIKQNNVTIYLNKGGGLINNLTFENSTVYNNGGKTDKRFIHYGGDRPNKVTGCTTGSINFRNCTFYNVSYAAEMGNYSGFAGQKTLSLNLLNNIFVNCGKQEIVRRLLGGRAGMVANYKYNTYWFDGVFSQNELSYDNGGLVIQSDPMLADPQNGDFTPQGSEQLQYSTGDPRWLPTTQE